MVAIHFQWFYILRGRCDVFILLVLSLFHFLCRWRHKKGVIHIGLWKQYWIAYIQRNSGAWDTINHWAIPWECEWIHCFHWRCLEKHQIASNSMLKQFYVSGTIDSFTKCIAVLAAFILKLNSNFDFHPTSSINSFRLFDLEFIRLVIFFFLVP